MTDEAQDQAREIVDEHAAASQGGLPRMNEAFPDQPKPPFRSPAHFMDFSLTEAEHTIRDCLRIERDLRSALDGFRLRLKSAADVLRGLRNAAPPTVAALVKERAIAEALPPSEATP